MTNHLGLDAFESEMENADRKGKKDQNKQNQGEGNKSIKRYLKDGETMLVRFPNVQTGIYTYKSHSDFEAEIRPHACYKMKGEEDLYDKAAEVLIKEAATFWRQGDKDKYKEIRSYSNRFEDKPRVILGSYDLETGEEILFDLAGKHAKPIVEVLKENRDDLHETPFKLKRSGTNQDTNYTLMAVKLNKLTEQQQEHFNNAKEEFDTALYEKSLFYKNEQSQLRDLEKMGFDVSRLNGEQPTTSVVEKTETAEVSVEEQQAPPVAEEKAAEPIVEEQQVEPVVEETKTEPTAVAVGDDEDPFMDLVIDIEPEDQQETA
jgi:hypothetical protein